MNGIPCRRCLLKDLTDSDYFANVYEYIDSLLPEVRTPPPEYERRLDTCRSCDHLVNGMCRLCGCFVEVRAAKRRNHCADSASFW